MARVRPKLLFTIDVEEDMPNWCIADPVSVRNTQALPQLASLCESIGVKPTYLCTYPIVTISESREVIRALALRGGCEIATHLHPWNTPPYRGIPGKEIDEQKTPYYMYELGADRFRDKLQVLHEAVAKASGSSPTSFRAGRFGLDDATLRVLIELGYAVDSSVTPLVHHDTDGGPDFRSAPQLPYRPHKENLRRIGNLPIVEIPVSVSLTRRMPPWFSSAYVRVPQQLRLRGLMSSDYLGLLDFAWLYPARFSAQLMQDCARVLASSGNPVLNVFLHSSELVGGASYYIKTDRDAQDCFTRIRNILEYCIRELGAEPATLTEAGTSVTALQDNN